MIESRPMEWGDVELTKEELETSQRVDLRETMLAAMENGWRLVSCHGSCDSVCPPSHTVPFFSALHAQQCDTHCEVLTIDGADHTFHEDDVIRRIVTILSQRLTSNAVQTS